MRGGAPRADGELYAQLALRSTCREPASRQHLVLERRRLSGPGTRAGRGDVPLRQDGSRRRLRRAALHGSAAGDRRAPRRVSPDAKSARLLRILCARRSAVPCPSAGGNPYHRRFFACFRTLRPVDQQLASGHGDESLAFTGLDPVDRAVLVRSHDLRVADAEPP